MAFINIFGSYLVRSFRVLLHLSILLFFLLACKESNCTIKTNYISVEFQTTTGFGSTVNNIQHNHPDIPADIVEGQTYQFTPGTFNISWDFDAMTFSDSCQHAFTLNQYTYREDFESKEQNIFDQKQCDIKEENVKYVIYFGTSQPFFIAGRTECHFSIKTVLMNG